MSDQELPARVLREVPTEYVQPEVCKAAEMVLPMADRPRQFGFVEPHEESTARAMIDEEFRKIAGKPFDYRPGGYFIAAKIYVRPDELSTVTRDDGTQVKLWRPPSATANDKYQSCSALVLAVGPQAYKGRNPDGSEKFPEGPWCRVGDWICIKRYESFLVNFRGVPIAIFPDDQVLGVIADPTDITPIHQNDRH